MALVGTINSSNDFGLKNRIINGAMVIDQRNAGASYSAVDSTYGLDRWKLASYDSNAQTGKYTVIQSSTAPTGFSTSMLITSSAAANAATATDLTQNNSITAAFTAANSAAGDGLAFAIALG